MPAQLHLPLHGVTKDLEEKGMRRGRKRDFSYLLLSTLHPVLAHCIQPRLQCLSSGAGWGTQQDPNKQQQPTLANSNCKAHPV